MKPFDPSRQAYRAAIGVAFVAAFLLLWMIPAVGVIGAEGNPADLMYIAVFTVGLVGVLVTRLEARGMVRVIIAVAVTQMLVACTALLMGEHHSPVTSVMEILGLNGFFASLFAGSAWLFRYSVELQATREG